jgi:hypothetical protein
MDENGTMVSMEGDIRRNLLHEYAREKKSKTSIMSQGTLASTHSDVALVIFSPGKDIARSDSGYCSKVEDRILSLVSTYIRWTELHNDEPLFRGPAQALGS